MLPWRVKDRQEADDAFTKTKGVRMASDIQVPRKRDCTTSTCMKWGNDGSLSPHDQNELMKRLCEKDPALAGSDACRIFDSSENKN